MSLNSIILNGSLPHFEPNTYNKGTEEKKGFLSWALSCQRDFKKADEKYYPSDLLSFKAFGPTADFIMNFFNQGDGIIITGRVQRDDDYEDANGEKKKGQMYILVESAKFPVGKGNGSDDSSAGASTPTPAKKPGIPGANKPSAPLAGKRPGIPGKKPF